MSVYDRAHNATYPNRAAQIAAHVPPWWGSLRSALLAPPAPRSVDALRARLVQFRGVGPEARRWAVQMWRGERATPPWGDELAQHLSARKAGAAASNRARETFAERNFIPPRLTRKNRWHTWRPPVEPADLAVTAFHEAGHAVVGLALGVNPRAATIARDGDTLGSVTVWHKHDAAAWCVRGRHRYLPPYAIAWVFSEVCLSMAGPVTQHLWFDADDPEDDRSLALMCFLDETPDAAEAVALLYQAFGETALVGGFFLVACHRLRLFLNQRAARWALGKIASLLLERQTIGEAEIRSIGYVPKNLSLSEPECARWATRFAVATSEGKDS